jgi:hypothetical protein
LAAKGGSKGKAGGKGGPTGGKGPTAAAATLAEVGAEDTWAGDLLNDTIAGAAAEFDEWDFSTGAVCSLTAAPPPIVAARPLLGTTLLNTGAATSASSRLGQYKTFAARPFLGKAPVGKTAGASGSTRPARVVATLAAGTPAIATKNSFDALSFLTDDADELLAAVSGDTPGRQVVEAVVDSGAVHSVTPPGLFPGPTLPSPWSRTGRGYKAANGTGIRNLGQIAVKFATAEGDRCSIPFQVAEVEQPLLSVAHLTAAGNRVELGHTSGRVVNTTTGRAIALERRGGVYIMRMYVQGVAPAPFRRQGA